MSSPSASPRGESPVALQDHLALAVLSTMLTDHVATGETICRTLYVQAVPRLRQLLDEWEALGRVKRVAKEGQPVKYLATVPPSELARLAAQTAARIEWAARGQRAKRGGQAEAAEPVERTEGGGL